MCEACDAIYPLYDAILQYTIETLVLNANILRDSILVRLEMVARPFTLTLTLNGHPNLFPHSKPYPNPNATPNPYHYVCSIAAVVFEAGCLRVRDWGSRASQ